MEKKKLVSKKALEAEEKALLAIKQIEGQKKVQRITIDMPIFLYDRIKEETEKKDGSRERRTEERNIGAEEPLHGGRLWTSP